MSPVRGNGTAACWGLNYNGQLGMGRPGWAGVPGPVQNFGDRIFTWGQDW